MAAQIIIRGGVGHPDPHGASFRRQGAEHVFVGPVIATVPPAAGSALRVTLDAVVDWLNDGDRDWPPSIPVADGVDASHLARRLRMGAVWAGRCRVGAFKAGDGTAWVAAELTGEHATVTLALVIDPETRLLRMADVTP